jgi:hypothetical protein
MGEFNMGKLIGMCLFVLFFSTQTVLMVTSVRSTWWHLGASVILIILLIAWVVARFAEDD